MKRLLTVSLCIGVLALSIWTYNTNINASNNTNIISDKIISHDIDDLRKEMLEVKRYYKPVHIDEAKTEEQVKTKRFDNNVSRGEELELIPLKVVATAYAPYENFSGICNDGDPNNTSTGTKPDWGCVAVDPKEIPYGTKLIVEGYNNGKICIAQDTGSALRRDKKNIRIDLYMDTYEQAMNWGVREITVYIVK